MSSKGFVTEADFIAFLSTLNQRQNSRQTSPNIATEALIHAIREKSKEDPLVGVKIGGKEIYQRLIEAMTTPQGVHIESLLCACGALAGYACQASVAADAEDKG